MAPIMLLSGFPTHAGCTWYKLQVFESPKYFSVWKPVAKQKGGHFMQDKVIDS